MGNNTFNPDEFVLKEPKPLPIMLMLDVSGSMDEKGKIDALNNALKEMIKDFCKQEIKIIVCIITFGDQVNCFTYNKLDPNPHAFVEVKELLKILKDFPASGMTPMGKALEMAKAIIEDKAQTPGKAYRPAVILVSDGQPNDNWQKPLEDFINDGRSKKCDRMAMAIGNDADKNVLNKFIEGTNNPLFEAHKVTDISSFFKFVTMSVEQRTHSANPDIIPSVIKQDVDNLKNASSLIEDEDELF